MRAEAARRGLSVKVFSMGLIRSGLPMPGRGIAVAAEFGLDLRDHLSEQLRLDRLEAVDLVLGMSRTHVREVVSAMPSVWPRAFTLKQFSRFAAGRTVPRRARLSSWLESEAEERSRGELLGHSVQDDIADPLRASVAVWRTVIREIDHHVGRLLDDCEPLLLPAGRARPTSDTGKPTRLA
jgi:protein-tyrosine phosphatase